jgi:neurofibromin 1
MILLGAICDTTSVTEADKVAKSLIYVFQKHSKALPAMMYRTAVEIQLAESENTLFRGNSMASKMFNTYCKMVGLEYLWETLGLIMYELAAISKIEDDNAIMLKTSMEVDPHRMEGNEDIFTNQLQLKLFAHKLWKAIIASEKKVPRLVVKDVISDSIFQRLFRTFPRGCY